MGTPQITDQFSSQESNFLWGTDAQRGQVLVVSGVADGAARDTTNTPTTLLRPGLVLARKNGKWINYSATGTGGQQIARGILGAGFSMIDYAASNIDQQVPIVVRGPVIPSALIGLDLVARSQLHRQGFLFSDFVQAAQFPWDAVTTVTADTTLTADDSGTKFIANGAAKVTFTLPALAAGLIFWFYNVGASGMRIASASADTMIVGNDIAADNIEFVTTGEMIGAAIVVYPNSDATKWLVENVSCPATTKTGSTVTVNT